MRKGENMCQEKKVIVDAIQIVRETTELFYQQKIQEGYTKMQDAIAGIMQVVDVLHEYKSVHEEFSLDENRIVGSLTEAMNAMETGDTVLLADILEYDFIEYLQELSSELD